MPTLKQDIQALIADAKQGAELRTLMTCFGNALCHHPEALTGRNGRFRLCVTDTETIYSFALTDGVYQPLAAQDPVDVTLRATEVDLLKLIRQELPVPLALFTGRLKIQGSQKTLLLFTDLL